MSLHLTYAKCETGAQVSDYIQKLQNRPLLDIEGIWQWSDGSRVLIESDAKGCLLLTLIYSPDPLVDTPLVWGSGEPTGKSGAYNVRLHTSYDGDSGRFTSATATYIAKLADSGILEINPYSTGLKVDIRRLIPILSRIHIRRGDAPASLEGAIRIYPHALSPRNPAVL